MRMLLPGRRPVAMPSLARAPLHIGGAVVVAWFVVALTIDLWSPYAPLDMVGRRLQPPSWNHWSGTDALGPGLDNATLAMVMVWWPVFARLMRAQVLEVKQRERIEAAMAGGAGRLRILRVHVLPLCWTPIPVHATMDLGQVVLLAASLSFIGLGAAPPTPEWGAMIADGATNFYHWWIAFAPGLAILMLVLGFNVVGDGLRDALDPRTE